MLFAMMLIIFQIFYRFRTFRRFCI